MKSSTVHLTNLTPKSGLCFCKRSLCKNLFLKMFGLSETICHNADLTSFTVFINNSIAVLTKIIS
ncbi:hypothetical protein GW891_02895 [bacterium]|nr:hypothetical protein [bacterium]